MAATYVSEAVNVARDYYNSQDADTFYHTIWGGEDIHIGLYASDDEPIAAASRRTVELMASKLNGLHKDSRVLDIGAGYGGSMRYLAKTFGCQCVALNLSEAENARDRERNAEQGLADLIEVIDGSFEELAFPNTSFGVVGSQDAIVHSSKRRQVLEEVVRVLEPGGEFIMTDPMQADDCPPDVLQPILDRIHLETLGTPGFYRRTLVELGMEELGYEDLTDQLVNHYARVLGELERQEDKLKQHGRVSEDYIERMKKGLGHWVEGGLKGHLAWGILHFRK
jgi:sarcosine/dimethylglycine N-methyltransferase